MKKMMAAALAAILLLLTLAGCGGGEKQDVTWEEYQQWLIETFAESSPDPEGVTALIQGLKSWDDIDLESQPWAKFFGDEFFAGSTWDDFVAADGVGSYNTEYVDGAGGPSGDAPSGEPPADGASGEPTGEMNG